MRKIFIADILSPNRNLEIDMAQEKAKSKSFHIY